MHRRYVISIEASDAALANLTGIDTEFGCSVSEPSNWIEYGSTDDRGLTFLDKEGKELASPVFVHQPVFNALSSGSDSEIAEIREYVFQVLSKHYSVTAADVRIKVREYNRM
jgi:hypothetical protein